MEHLAQGIILAALSGITFVAYKHPEAYSKLYWWLLALSALANVAGTAYDVGISDAIHALSMAKSMDAAQRVLAVDAIGPRSLPGWIYAVLWGLVLYFLFLSSFPAWLTKTPTTESERAERPPQNPAEDV